MSAALQHRLRRLPLLLLVVLWAPRGLADDERPPVFSDKSFDAARAENRDSDRILVVKGTAVWCMPCKQMNKTTFRSDDVVAWFKEHGVVIEFDVDKEKELAKTLHVDAMPTLIAFKKGEEFDRVVGMKSPRELIAWLEGVRRGERAIDPVLKKLDDVRAGKAEVAMQERLSMAKQLMQAQRLDLATDEYAWLWENIAKKDRAMVGVRSSFMLGDMTQLAALHPPAKERFTKLRDALGEKVSKADVDDETLMDWSSLNEVVADEARTLEWFEMRPPDARPLNNIMLDRVLKLYQQRGRWADFGKLIKDPQARVMQAKRELDMMRSLPVPDSAKEHVNELRELSQRSFEGKVATVYAAMLAAGRESDAGEVLRAAMEIGDGPEMRIALVATALEAKQPRREHLEWLDKARAADAGDADARQARRERIDMLRKAVEGALTPAP